MNARAKLFLAWVGIVLASCGPGASGPSATTVGPHGGPMLSILDGAGYAEVVLEPGTDPRHKTTQVAVYFFGPDQTADLAPSPSDVHVSLTLEAKSPRDLLLTPAPDDRFRPGGLRFASAPGDYSADRFQGDLQLTLNGKTTTAPFRGVR